MAGSQGGAEGVYEYSMTSPWNVSTATYTENSKSYADLGNSYDAFTDVHFKYDGTIMDIMPVVKDYLESKKYDIIHYAPESGYILTDFKLFSMNSGKVYLALSININDLVVVVGMGKYEIVTSGIGNPDEMLKMKAVDRLPYRLQKKILSV